MDPPTVYATSQGGDQVAAAIATSDATLGYATHISRPPGELEIGFCDYPFTERTFPFRKHLREVEIEQPTVAVAPDIEKRRDPAEVYEQADQLAEYADHVVVIAKSIHPAEIPDRFRVGIPTANFGSDAEWSLEAYQDVGDCHLLGGSPNVQLAVADYDIDVASVDTSVPIAVAENGMEVWAGRWKSGVPEDIGIYELITHSYNNYVEAWEQKAETGSREGGDYWYPENAANRDDVRRAMHGHGPPLVDAESRDARTNLDGETLEGNDLIDIGGDVREVKTVSREEVADAMNDLESKIIAKFPDVVPDEQSTLEAFETTGADDELETTDDGLPVYLDTRPVGGEPAETIDGRSAMELLQAVDIPEEVAGRILDEYDDVFDAATISYRKPNPRGTRHPENENPLHGIEGMGHERVEALATLSPLAVKTREGYGDVTLAEYNPSGETVVRIEAPDGTIEVPREDVEAIDQELAKAAAPDDDYAGPGQISLWNQEAAADAIDQDEPDVDAIEQPDRPDPMEEWEDWADPIDAINAKHLREAEVGDELLINDRQRPLRVREIADEGDTRSLYLKGGAHGYSIEVTDDWLPNRARFTLLDGANNAGSRELDPIETVVPDDVIDEPADAIDQDDDEFEPIIADDGSKWDEIEAGSTIVLVGCGKSKNEGRLPAREKYSSSYFAQKRDFAEEADHWFIISAEYGLLHPDDPIEDYDTVITDVDAEKWGRNVTAELDEEAELDGTTVVLLAGKDYRQPLEDRLEAAGAIVQSPFEQTSGIGEQQSWLADHDPDDLDNDSTMSDYPERIDGGYSGDWERTSTDPLRYESEDGDVASIDEDGNAWYRFENAEARLGFGETQAEAERELVDELEDRFILDLRSFARRVQEYDDYGLDDNEIRRATSNDVKGSPAKTLGYYYDELDAIAQASDAELLALDGVGPKTVESLREHLDEPADDQEEPDTIEVPDEIAGYELDEESEGNYAWEGRGGSPPAHVPRDARTQVRVRSHGKEGSRHGYKWTADVRWWDDDEDGTPEHNTAIRVANLNTGDDARESNRERALEAAIEWMEDNPSTDESSGDQEDDQPDVDDDDQEESEWADGFKKTKISDLPGIGDKTEEKVHPTTTLSGIADTFSSNTVDPNPDVTAENREQIREALTESQMETLEDVLPEYAESARNDYDLAYLGDEPADDQDELDDEGAPFDPTELFADDVVDEMDVEVEWQDVEHPENVPEGEKETEVDFAERILKASGRAGLGHHEDIRSSMGSWAAEHEDHEDNPGYWRQMHYEMSPKERNMGRLTGDIDEQYKKARTVIAWASDTYDHDLLREIEREQSKDHTEAWREQAEEVANESKARELFASDPVDEYNGWERFEPDKPDAEVAYRGETYGTPSVVTISTRLGTEAVTEHVLEEWNEAETAEDAKVNRHAAGTGGTIYEDLKNHLESFDAEPIDQDELDDEPDDRPDRWGPDLELPSEWTIDQASEDSVMLEHEADDHDVSAELWKSPSADGKWDAAYTINGTTADGIDRPVADVQAAADDMIDFVEDRLESRRDFEEQQAEMNEVEWPDEIGRYELDPASESESKAEYFTHYIRGKTALGPQTGDDSLQIKFYDRDKQWNVGGAEYDRKQEAIDAARDELLDRTEKYNKIEEKAVEENDLPDYHIPERLKDDEPDVAIEKQGTTDASAQVYDPTTEWKGAEQQALGDAAGQAEFNAPVEASAATEIEEPQRVNEGGLMADTREDVGDDDDAIETTQGGLETFDQGGRRDAAQDGLDSFDEADETDYSSHPNPTYQCDECGHTVENAPRHIGGPCIYGDGEMQMIDPGTGETEDDEGTPTIYKAERNRWPLLSPYDHKSTKVDDLSGIGKTTGKKFKALETDVIADIAAIEDTDTLREMGDVLPTGNAVDTLTEAIEQSAEKHGHGIDAAEAIREGYEGVSDDVDDDQDEPEWYGRDGPEFDFGDEVVVNGYEDGTITGYTGEQQNGENLYFVDVPDSISGERMESAAELEPSGVTKAEQIDESDDESWTVVDLTDATDLSQQPAYAVAQRTDGPSEFVEMHREGYEWTQHDGIGQVYADQIDEAAAKFADDEPDAPGEWDRQPSDKHIYYHENGDHAIAFNESSTKDVYYPISWTDSKNADLTTELDDDEYQREDLETIADEYMADYDDASDWIGHVGSTIEDGPDLEKQGTTPAEASIYDPTIELDADHQGPTADRPIPEPETSDLPGGVDEREIYGTALSASDWDESPEITHDESEPPETFEQELAVAGVDDQALDPVDEQADWNGWDLETAEPGYLEWRGKHNGGQRALIASNQGRGRHKVELHYVTDGIVEDVAKTIDEGLHTWSHARRVATEWIEENPCECMLEKGADVPDQIGRFHLTSNDGEDLAYMRDGSPVEGANTTNAMLVGSMADGDYSVHVHELYVAADVDFATITREEADGIDVDKIDKTTHDLRTDELTEAKERMVEYIDDELVREGWVSGETLGDHGEGPDETETVEFEFGSRAAAKEVREEHLEDGMATDKYDGRHKSIELYAGAVDDDLLETINGIAADSRADGNDGYGQLELTDGEQRRLEKRDGWTAWRNKFHAESVKAILTAEGIDDWTAHYDHTLTVDEHKADSYLETAKSDSGGHDDDELTEDEVDEKIADAHARADSERFDNALKWCKNEADEAACKELIDNYGWTEDEIEALQARLDELDTTMGELPTDDGGRLDDEPADEDVPIIPEDGQLTPNAKGTLARAWRGYRAAAGEAIKKQAAIEDYRKAREDAREYGAVINEVRQTFNQEPIEIEAQISGDPVSVDDLPTVEWKHEETSRPTQDTEQVTLSGMPTTLKGWVKECKEGGCYDPTEEFA